MRTYGKIESAFWQNPRVRQLTGNGKLLLIYIYSTHHGNSIGSFILPIGYIAEDMNWETELVREHVSELVREGFIERNEANKLTRIMGWFEHNTIENQNVAKAALKTFESLPDCEIKDSTFNVLKEIGNKFINELLNPLPNTFLNPEPKPEPKKVSKNPTEVEDRSCLPGIESDLNLNDFACACAVLAELLGKKQLARQDQETVGFWCATYDMRGEALPLIGKKFKQYFSKNGEPPKSLKYFNNMLAEGCKKQPPHMDLGKKLRTV